MTRGRGEARREHRRGGEKGGEKNICLSSLSWHLHMEAMKILLVGNDFSDFRARSLEISLFSRLAGGWTCLLLACGAASCHIVIATWDGYGPASCSAVIHFRVSSSLTGCREYHQGFLLIVALSAAETELTKKKHDHVSVYLA